MRREITIILIKKFGCAGKNTDLDKKCNHSKSAFYRAVVSDWVIWMDLNYSQELQYDKISNLKSQ